MVGCWGRANERAEVGKSRALAAIRYDARTPRAPKLTNGLTAVMAQDMAAASGPNRSISSLTHFLHLPQSPRHFLHHPQNPRSLAVGECVSPPNLAPGPSALAVCLNTLLSVIILHLFTHNLTVADVRLGGRVSSRRVSASSLRRRRCQHRPAERK